MEEEIKQEIKGQDPRKKKRNNNYEILETHDPRTCETNEHVGGGSYICAHFNLEVLHPELIPKWVTDSKKNTIPMNKLSPGSKRKIWLRCLDNQLSDCDCHIYECEVNAVTNPKKKPYGCPFCASRQFCNHYNLETKFSELKKFWHEDNKRLMSSYGPYSHELAKFICPLNPCGCHIYIIPISHRTRDIEHSGCGFCSGTLKCAHNNLEATHPHLIDVWSDKNEKKMSEYSKGMEDFVWWKCEYNECGCHEDYKCQVYARIRQEIGCKRCTNKIACSHYNLLTEFPEIALEWSTRNIKTPAEVLPHSNDYAEFVCRKTGVCSCHIWWAQINSRTGGGNGCPFCAGRPCPHNNLYTHFPELILEWHPKNPPITSFPPFSKELVTFICPKGHNRTIKIFDRTVPGRSRCHQCPATRGFSKAQIEWLDSIDKKEIQHILNGGEFKIPTAGKVDGFDEKSNTAYEYHGSYWHGHPKRYDMEEKNQVNKKTFGQLYLKTVVKDVKIIAAGYNLVIRWEVSYEDYVYEIMSCIDPSQWNYFYFCYGNGNSYIFWKKEHKGKTIKLTI